MKLRALAVGLALFTACKSKEEAPPPTASFDASALLAAATATNPAAMEKGAREQFGTKFSCPDERITAKRRDASAPAPSPAPPDEVKNDPARLEKWKADQQKEKDFAAQKAAEHAIFELEGCNHTQVLDCRPHHANGAVYPDWADCSEVKPARDGGR